MDKPLDLAEKSVANSRAKELVLRRFDYLTSNQV
jgi:hypothetical protein